MVIGVNFFFKIKITKKLFFFLSSSSSFRLEHSDVGFRFVFKKENKSSSSSSIRLEYFKYRLWVDFYNRV